jgi:hypothetical protein
MTDKGDDELGSRCIWCGEPFSAHVGDWCNEDEDNTVTNAPVDRSINCPQPAASNVIKLPKRR